MMDSSKLRGHTADGRNHGPTRRTAERWKTERRRRPQTCLAPPLQARAEIGHHGARVLHPRDPGPDPSVKKYSSRRLCVGLAQGNQGNSGGQLSLLAEEFRDLFWYQGKGMAQRNSGIGFNSVFKAHILNKRSSLKTIPVCTLENINPTHSSHFLASCLEIYCFIYR